MDNDVYSVTMDYGDAELTFFNIKIKTGYGGTPVWHKHDYYELHTCLSGEVTYTLEQGTILLGRMQSLLIPPAEHHLSVDAAQGRGAGLRVVSFSLSPKKGDESLLAIFQEALARHALQPMCIPALAELDTDILHRDAMYRSVSGILQLKEICARLAHALFGHIVDGAQTLPLGKRELMVLIDNMVYLPEISLDDIARATNYSKRHVSRLICRKYGCSLGKLRKRIKEGTADEDV